MTLPQISLPPEAVLGAFSTLVEGISLISKTALWKKAQRWRGKELQQLKLRSALDAALAETSAAHPFLEVSLFDEHFLQSTATRLITSSLGAKSIASMRANLLSAWTSELGATLAPEHEREMLAAVDDFLHSLEGELLKCEEFRPLLIGNYQRVSASALGNIETGVSKIADIVTRWEAQRSRLSPGSPVGHVEVYDDWLLPVPSNLLGRSAELDWVLERCRSHADDGCVLALHGIAGVGKTSIAGTVVRRLRAENVFDDGITVVVCQRMTTPASVLNEVLDRFQFQVAPNESSDYYKVAEAVVRHLRPKKALIVLDNVEPQLAIAEVLRPLQAAGLCVLVTSRHAVSSAIVSPNNCLSVRPLLLEDAVRLFKEHLSGGGGRVVAHADQLAITQIVEHLARHTLAVKLAAAYATVANRDLQELAEELSYPQRALALPEGETPDAVRLVFTTSLEQLPSPAITLFGDLAIFASDVFGRNAALAIARRVDPSTPEMLLDLLVRWALLEAFTNEQMPRGSDRERLRLHPLLRALAEADLGTRPEADRDESQRRLAVHYIMLLERTDAMPTIADLFASLAPDELNIRGSLEWAHAHHDNAGVAALTLGLQPYWLYVWHQTDSLRYLSWGIDAARQQAEQTGLDSDERILAILETYRGEALVRSGRVGDAILELTSTLASRESLSDMMGTGFTLGTLGRALAADRRLDEAMDCFVRAQAIFEKLHMSQEIGSALFEQAKVMQELGTPKETIRYCTLALGELEKGAERVAIGAVLGVMANAQLELGNHREAEETASRALAILREAHVEREQAVVLHTLGRAAYIRGDLDKAENYYNECARIRRDFEDVLNESALLLGLGQVDYARGRLVSAYRLYQQALELSKKFGDRREEGVITFELALVAEEMGDADFAEALHRQSLNTAIEVGQATDVADSYVGLGNLLARKGKRSEAADMLDRAASIYSDLGMQGKARTVAHQQQRIKIAMQGGGVDEES